MFLAATFLYRPTESHAMQLLKKYVLGCHLSVLAYRISYSSVYRKVAAKNIFL